MKAMTGEEVEAFLKAATNNRMYVYFDLLLATGLRPAEALALKWQDFDPVTKTIRIVRTLEYINGKASYKEPKTKRFKRTINIHNGTVSMLLDHKQQQSVSSDLIFPSLDGTPLNSSNVLNRYFKPCLLECNLAERVKAKKDTKIKAEFRLYDLRHTHATMLLKANVHPKIVSERLGHASVALTLDVYSHILPTIQGAAVDAVGAALYQGKAEQNFAVLN